MTRTSFSVLWIKRLIILGASMFSCLFAACGSEIQPLVIVTKSGAPIERVVVFSEEIPQSNCNGTSPARTEVERSRTIKYEAEVSGGSSLDAGGELGIPDLGKIQVGAVLAAEYGVSYGESETIRRQVDITTAAGSHLLHIVEQVEYWDTGSITIIVGEEKQAQYPYRFRTGFGVIALEPQPLPCPSPTPQAEEEVVEVQSTATADFPATPAPSPTTGMVPTATIVPATATSAAPSRSDILDQTFGAENWFCFPERQDAVGVTVLLTDLTFTDEMPFQSIEKDGRRYSRGEMIQGGEGVTVWYFVPVSECPADQALPTVLENPTRQKLDALVGTGNWRCYPNNVPNAIVIESVPSSFVVRSPISNVDKNSQKYGFNRSVPAVGPATAWLQGNLPRDQCP